jgi:hypothetical protein
MYNRIKATGVLLPLLILITIGLENCATCDNCEISPSPKQVTVVDKLGKNLIFGASAVYDPDNIVITNQFGEVIEFFKNTTNESIDFSYNVKATDYFIKLSPSDTDTIVFSYGKDKQIDCCAEFDVTATTKVNGKTVANDDAISIVK